MGWQQERDDEVVAAYAAGASVAEIERDYGVTQEQIAEIVGGPVQAPPASGGLHNRGNRILLGIGIGFVVASFAGLLGSEGPAVLGLWVVTAACVYPLAKPRG